MTKKKDDRDVELGLGDDPLADVGDPLVDVFYQPQKSAPVKAKARGKSRARQPLPEGRTFRLVTFSFYEEDVERLDELLEQARKSGHRRVSRSQLVRLALRQVDLKDLPEFV